MKSFKKTWTLICLCCVVLSSFPVFAQQTWDPYPDSLNIGKNHLDYVSYPFRAGQFLRFFQYFIDNQQFRFDSADIFETVKRDQLMDLQNKIADPKDKKSYAALSVIYGLKVDTPNKKAKMTFIYLPVLVRLNDITPGDIDTFDVIPGGDPTPHSTEKYYYIVNSSGDLEPVQQSNLNAVTSWISAYQSYIYIDPKGTGVFRNHEANDVTSETFSFKSLEHYFNKYPTVYITCGAKQAEELGVDTFRHYVAFANKPFNVALDPTSTQAADLGTLCPPNCLITRVVDGYVLPKSMTGYLIAAAIAALFAVTYFFRGWKRKEKRP